MRKREAWMKQGAKILALGKPGRITKVQRNFIGNVEYVYYIDVQLDNERISKPYHPADIQQMEVAE